MRQCWRQENERAQMDDVVKQVDKAKDDFKQGKFNIKPSRPAPKKPVPKTIKPAMEEEKKIEPERVKVLPLLEETSRGDKRLAGVGEDKDVKQRQLTTNAKEEKGGKKKKKSKTDNLPPKEENPVDPEPITSPSNRDVSVVNVLLVLLLAIIIVVVDCLLLLLFIVIVYYCCL